MEGPEPQLSSAPPGSLHHAAPRPTTIPRQSVMLACERTMLGKLLVFFFSWCGEEVMELRLVWTSANFLPFSTYCHCCLTVQTTASGAEEGGLGPFPPRTLLLCYPPRSDYVGTGGTV